MLVSCGKPLLRHGPYLTVFSALQIPKRMPEQDLQSRWFAEPVQYLTLTPDVFQANKSGFPALSKHHQQMIFALMRLKITPWLLLCDTGPDVYQDTGSAPNVNMIALTDHFPALGNDPSRVDSSAGQTSSRSGHLDYLTWLATQQPPLSDFEGSTLTSFQDWLQSPLQPLSDNLESATYEVFEGDPVKYNQYEAAVTEALSEWRALKKAILQRRSSGHCRRWFRPWSASHSSSPSSRVYRRTCGSLGGGEKPKRLRVPTSAKSSYLGWPRQSREDRYASMERTDHIRICRVRTRIWQGRYTHIRAPRVVWGQRTLSRVP